MDLEVSAKMVFCGLTGGGGVVPPLSHMAPSTSANTPTANKTRRSIFIGNNINCKQREGEGESWENQETFLTLILMRTSPIVIVATSLWQQTVKGACLLGLFQKIFWLFAIDSYKLVENGLL